MPANLFNGNSHKLQYNFIQKYKFDLKFLYSLIFIRVADFSCKVNNKRIIEFGFSRISELFRLRSTLSRPIIFNYVASMPTSF